MSGKDRRKLGDLLPAELGTVLAFAVAIFGVVSTGGVISAAIDQPSPWLIAAAYGGPASIAFGVYWLVARRRAPESAPEPDDEP